MGVFDFFCFFRWPGFCELLVFLGFLLLCVEDATFFSSTPGGVAEKLSPEISAGVEERSLLPDTTTDAVVNSLLPVEWKPLPDGSTGFEERSIPSYTFVVVAGSSLPPDTSNGVTEYPLVRPTIEDDRMLPPGVSS